MIAIEIHTENAAFNPEVPDGWRQEVAFLVHEAADQLLVGKPLPATLRDYNGNPVGTVKQISNPAGDEAAA